MKKKSKLELGLKKTESWLKKMTTGEIEWIRIDLGKQKKMSQYIFKKAWVKEAFPGLKKLKRKKIMRKTSGQTATEYMVLIVVLAAAFLTMMVYIKRSIQGNLKDRTDSLSEDQYDPRYAKMDFNATVRGRHESLVTVVKDPKGWYTKRVESSPDTEMNLNIKKTVGSYK